MVDTGITMDLAQLVLDDEYAAMIRQTVAGIAVDDESLMLDEIHAVGSWSDYLSRELTLERVRAGGFSNPRLFERRVYDAWEQDGMLDAYERARTKASTILDEHEVEPLCADVQEEIDAILEAAEHGLGSAEKCRE
jgi:trimethylamine--corrinoid protein Co-methyltransferase